MGIDMKRSERTVSFDPSSEHTTAAREVRLQQRSSLDNFVIPGRTRLPSSNSTIYTDPSQDPTNIQIAQALLDQSNMGRVRRAPININGNGRALTPSGSPRVSRSRGHRRHRSNTQSSRAYNHQDDITFSPSHQRASQGSQELLHSSRNNAVQDQSDGPSDLQDSQHLRRTPSTAWRRCGQKQISRSSLNPSSKAASEFARAEYNLKALQHGFPPLPVNIDGEFMRLFV